MKTSNSCENHLRMGDNKTGKPLQHYMSAYQTLDPQEISERCNIEFDNEKQTFYIRILGTEHAVTHPEFTMLNHDGKETENDYEKILVLRYLCEGKFFPSRGKQLSYREFPWGEIYYRNFEGRCLKRCAFTFGRDIKSFIKLIESNPHLYAESLGIGDASYRFEFLNGLYVSVILWQDEEFPPSAQILFDDNFVFAFTAEDLAVTGDILIERLKGLMPKQ